MAERKLFTFRRVEKSTESRPLLDTRKYLIFIPNELAYRFFLMIINSLYFYVNVGKKIYFQLISFVYLADQKQWPRDQITISCKKKTELHE